MATTEITKKEIDDKYNMLLSKIEEKTLKGFFSKDIDIILDQPLDAKLRALICKSREDIFIHKKPYTKTLSELSSSVDDYILKNNIDVEKIDNVYNSIINVLDKCFEHETLFFADILQSEKEH